MNCAAITSRLTNCFADAFQDGFEEQSHRLVGARAQRHELRVLAEMIEEELPNGPEVLLDLHLFLQIFELLQIQSHKSSWKSFESRL
jgi:hypothetical protein